VILFPGDSIQCLCLGHPLDLPPATFIRLCVSWLCVPLNLVMSGNLQNHLGLCGSILIGDLQVSLSNHHYSGLLTESLFGGLILVSVVAFRMCDWLLQSCLASSLQKKFGVCLLHSVLSLLCVLLSLPCVQNNAVVILLNLMMLTTGGGDLLEEAAGGVCCGQAGSALPGGHP